MTRRVQFLLLVALVSMPLGSAAQTPRPALLHERIDRAAEAVLPKVVTWRRDLHQHPELGNREFETSKKMAAHLAALGLEVRTGVAKTGVVGVLRPFDPILRGRRRGLAGLQGRGRRDARLCALPFHHEG